MTRLFLIASLFTVCASSTTRMDDPAYLRLIVDFNIEMNAYIRDLFGCPASAMNTRDCHGPRSINYGAYTKAAKLAARIFP
jgi:hypothetical protein